MLRLVFPLFASMLIGGCGSISDPLPKCDGYSNRPLNRSMWQWKDTKHASLKPSGYVMELEPSSQRPFARFDEQASYVKCGKVQL